MQIKACQILQNKIKFDNHDNNKNCIKANFEAYKEDSDKNISFWKIIWDNCGFRGILYSILEFGNHGNKQTCIKIAFDDNKEGRYKDIDFWKIV